jgi:hypothetical protein
MKKRTTDYCYMLVRYDGGDMDYVFGYHGKAAVYFTEKEALKAQKRRGGCHVWKYVPHSMITSND